MRRKGDPFAIGGTAARFDWRVTRGELPDSLPTPAPGGTYVGGSLSRRRLRISLWVIASAMGLLVGRTAYLQLARGVQLRQIADGNRLRILEVPAQRGRIFDRYGEPLVGHEPNLRLTLTPVDLPREVAERDRLFDEVAALVQQPADELRQTWRGFDLRSYQPVLVAEGMSREQAIAAAMLSGRYGSVRLEVATRRRYLTDGVPSLSHVLGYLGKISEQDFPQASLDGYALTDVRGKSGVELALEETLRGRKGREQIEVDATGRKIEVIADDPARPGDDVILTVDRALQQQLEAALQEELRLRRLPRGAAVALDPRSGEVLALVSLPSYDNNVFARGIRPEEFAELVAAPDQPLFNRAIQGAYPPGSTVKPLVAAAGLQEGLVDERTTYRSVGGLRVNAWYFPDWKAGGHGPTNLTTALAESVNTYFYYVGGGYGDVPGLGVQRMTTYLRRAGLGARLGIELAGEASGLVPDPAWKEAAIGQPWYIGDTYHLAIGQGDLLVTPLQVAAFTAVVANGGTLYRPQLVREVRPAGVQQGNRRQAQVIRGSVFASNHLAAVRHGLRQAVRTGSASALNGLPLAVAGKTGTAQWSSTKNHHAWFTGYAPADDPEVVLTVLIEEGGEGSAVAVPVAYRFFTWWASQRP